jgi:hypothetical protein
MEERAEGRRRNEEGVTRGKAEGADWGFALPVEAG